MTTVTNLFDQAEERLDQEEVWVKLENAGDQLTMIVDSFSMQKGQFGTYPVVRGLTKEGDPVALSGGRSVLKARLTENPPAKGDVLSIRYLGAETSEKSGRTYHAYKVVLVDGGAPRPAAIATAEEAAEDNDPSTDW